ncbi:MAG: hypothetical protein LBP79_01890 [Clostridiales bacterium]|jgi:hypothetical protein|nr:hypothetical protein [Clostridiales bacterium]
MEIWIKKLFAQIAFYMMRALDAMTGMFRALTGLSEVNVEGGSSTDLLTYFLENENITNAGVLIMLIALACLALFTVVGIIKSMTNPKKPQGKVLAQFFSAIIAFFIAQAVIFGGIAVSNQILGMVDEATSAGSGLSISQRIFALSIDGDGWRDNNTVENFSPKMTPNEVFGVYDKDFGLEKAPGGYEEHENENGEIVWEINDKTYKSGGIVNLYQTNLFLLFVTPLILIILIGTALLKLTRRIFDIVVLYLAMPFFLSSIPLDDGSRFKLWRENIITKTLSVYGTVLAFNVFLMFLDALGSFRIGGEGDFVNVIFSLVLIIGGAMAAAGGADLFSSLLGGQPNQGGNLGQMIYSGMQGMALGGAIARGGRSILIGGRGGRGVSAGAAAATGGIGGGVLGLAKSAANAAGTLALGNKYTAAKSSMGTTYQNLKNTLAGRPISGSSSGRFVDAAQKFMTGGGALGAYEKHLDAKREADILNPSKKWK